MEWNRYITGPYPGPGIFTKIEEQTYYKGGLTIIRFRFYEIEL